MVLWCFTSIFGTMKVIEQGLVERLNKVMNANKETMNSFANRCNIDSSGMRLKLLGQQTITRGNIIKVCNAYGVSRKWLEDGEGSMYDNDNYYNIGGNTNIGSHVENSVQVAMGTSKGDSTIGRVSDILVGGASKDMLIEALQQQIADLRQQLSEQQQQNKILMKMLYEKNKS